MLNFKIKFKSWWFNHEGAKIVATFLAGFAIAKKSILMLLAALTVLTTWYYKAYQIYKLKNR